MKARLIARDLKENQVPVSWTYPHLDTFRGAQVLSAERALEILLNGDASDDWYRGGKYDHVAFFSTTGCTGERGPLTYQAITAEDVTEMRVMSRHELSEAMLEVAEDLGDEAWDEMGFPDAEFLIGYHIERIAEKARVVTPEFIETI